MKFWVGKTIVITGGSGSFGRAFTKVLLHEDVRSIRIYSRGEHAQDAMCREFHNNGRLRWVIGDVRDRDRLRRSFEGVDVVVHAAALKRIEVGERDPLEAVKTNVGGAQNVIEAAIDAGVERVMALSSDKAAAPVTLYGATKLVAERAFVSANDTYGKRVRFSCARYGNIVGSQGSVIPLWLQQRETGTVDITDPTMTRFWYSLGEAVRFVRDRIEEMVGGEVFLPRLQAHDLATLAAAVAPDAVCRIIGDRGNEKHDEVMFSADEAAHVEARPYGFVYSSRIRRTVGGAGYSSATAPQMSAEDIMLELPHALREAGL